MLEAYTSGHVAAIYGVSVNTVNRWCSTFADYLSESANPGGSRHRRYSKADMTVFDLISSMANDGKQSADILASLSSGARGASPEETPDDIQRRLDGGHENFLELRLQDTERAMRELNSERERLIKLNSEKDERIMGLERELAQKRGEFENLKNTLDQRIEDAKQMGRLEAQIEMLKQKASGD